jgi:hypothetical protein
MAGFNYLFGAPWTCMVSAPAMNGQPAQTMRSTVTFDAVPGNVMHVRFTSANLTGDQYFGYSTKQNMYWSSSANSMGESVTQVSTDGKTYMGTAPMGSTSVVVRDTYSKSADNRMSFHDVATVNGKDEVTDGNCTR